MAVEIPMILSDDTGERPSKTKNNQNRIMKKLAQLFAVLAVVPVSIAFYTSQHR
jgi:hypothetical protein